MPDELPLNVAKKIFFENVIEVGIESGHPRRLVAKVERWGGGSRGGEHGYYNIFVPENWDDDYDLVLTLATDGMTYPVYDCDDTEQRRLALVSGCMITPSNKNWGAWSSWPEEWSEFLAKLEDHPNEGYYAMNATRGWCALRPPWVPKDDVPSVRWKNRNEWSGFIWDRYEQYLGEEEKEVPEELRGVSLNDLFGEDQ